MQTEFEGSNDSFLRMLYSGNSGRVAIYAHQVTDVLFIRALLRQSGYVPMHASRHAPDDAFTVNFGSIVVYRSGQEKSTLHLLNTVSAQRVIVLSDQLDEDSILQMLSNGAHHYFNICESDTLLTARLEASLRKHDFSQKLKMGDVCFDLQSRSVTVKGRPVLLRPKEYELARYLFVHAGRIVTRDEILNAVWSLPKTVYSRRIDTTLCRIRDRLKLSPQSGLDLQLVRPRGYRLIQCPQSSAKKDVSAKETA
jgi:DNA-binding response OmpR family regulator